MPRPPFFYPADEAPQLRLALEQHHYSKYLGRGKCPVCGASPVPEPKPAPEDPAIHRWEDDGGRPT